LKLGQEFLLLGRLQSREGVGEAFQELKFNGGGLPPRSFPRDAAGGEAFLRLNSKEIHGLVKPFTILQK
jgi:hypothetical protein